MRRTQRPRNGDIEVLAPLLLLAVVGVAAGSRFAIDDSATYKLTAAPVSPCANASVEHRHACLEIARIVTTRADSRETAPRIETQTVGMLATSPSESVRSSDASPSR